MNIHFDPSEQGFVNEDRFFEILDRAFDNSQAPQWLYSYRKATGIEDSLGVDGFAKILNLKGVLVRVPFQIKTSEAAIYDHYAKYKVYWMDDILFVIAHPDMTDRVIWKKFIGRLEKIRQHNLVFNRIDRYLETEGQED